MSEFVQASRFLWGYSRSAEWDSELLRSRICLSKERGKKCEHPNCRLGAHHSETCFLFAGSDWGSKWKNGPIESKKSLMHSGGA